MKLKIGPAENPKVLTLLPEKVLLWPDQKLMALGDLHLGKAEALQSFGVNVPVGQDAKDLERLTQILSHHPVQHVVILGDLIHHRNSWNPDLENKLHAFFQLHSKIKWHLILGNHERGSEKFLKTFPLEIHIEDFNVDDINFSHGHKTPKDLFQIQGHIHPVVKIREGSTHLRLPCFALGPSRLVLPSFGGMTGGYEIDSKEFTQAFACASDFVFEVPLRALLKGSLHKK